jgi:hypothetical protein
MLRQNARIAASWHPSCSYLINPSGKIIQKESAMKKESGNSATGKVASWSIVGLVLAGTLLISGIADVSEGSGPMAKIFLFFLGAIIVVQIIPGLMLLGAMFKGIYSMFGKKAKVSLGEEKK